MEAERSFCLTKNEARLLFFWAVSQKPQLNGYWWGENEKGIPGLSNKLVDGLNGKLKFSIS